jgi:pyruvate dehydrogenase E2 component (dihydrolipoamide acetyltransferase)
MAFEFRLPDIGEGVAEGEVVQWFVQEGGSVQEDAPLVSVLTDKANVEIPSPKSGRVAKIHAAVGEKVKVGGLLVTIETDGEPPGGASPTPVPAAPSEAKPTGPPAATSAPPGAPVPPAASTPRAMPASAAAPTSGAAAAEPPPTPDARVAASPYLRRLANERGIDLAKVRGTGPGGRITEADLTAVPGRAPSPSVPSGPRTPAAPAVSSPPSPTSPAGPRVPDSEVSERIPVRGLRRVIAEHMVEATHRPAPFTYVEEVDMTELVLLRDKMAKHVERQGTRLSYLPFIVKGVVAGLKAHPRMNATMDDERNELVVRSVYHIGIATAAPDGLLVPVVRNADQKSLNEIAREIQDLAERGRAGKLTREELTGSTFTITSLGALGGVLATPILNYPEVGILGVHKIVRRPVYKADGALGPADLMNLSVTLDHRVLDGIVGAQFLATVKSYLEDPHQLFAELR